MSWIVIAAITLGAIVALAVVLFLCRSGRSADYEDLDFGTLRPPEPPAPIKYEFLE